MFVIFPIKNIFKIDGDIGKKASQGCRSVLFRYGYHTLIFQINDREMIALVFAQLCVFWLFNIDKTSR